MTPNLFLATQKVFQPHKWFRAPKTERPTRVTEFWTLPEPGRYEYIPGRGWYMIAKLKEASSQINEPQNQEGELVQPQQFEKLDKPIPVHRSRVLGRYLLDDEYKRRKMTTQIKNEQGKRVQAGFFQLDNGIAWVHCWDENGTFIPGDKSGYKLWCIDAATKEFRHMRKGDDPDYVRSRRSSRERAPVNRSQESLSTAFPSGPGSTRDGTSTTASSVRGMMSPTSTPSSRVQSRRNSPKRNNSIPLEEAKAALRRMAKEHEDAIAAAASARHRAISSDTVPTVERGRLMSRIAS
ncbi:hypothetical protein DE146DRAFT_215067 [Phaeosphaeria sp. MPI-PUGE-AT-0046c]|nr:hypothetical protein DE146DRAFT_215067 [Phaeosphaeria sp. MPI-PUGE-AT-0046c]